MLDVTVILTLYRRPHNLARQVEAIRAQSFPPKHIWLWINYHDDNKDLDVSHIDVDRVFECSDNVKFHGRFAAALLADTKYVAIFDDDTIPGSKWFENCIQTECKLIEEGYKAPILGTAGVTLNSFRYETITAAAGQHKIQRLSASIWSDMPGSLIGKTLHTSGPSSLSALKMVKTFSSLRTHKLLPEFKASVHHTQLVSQNCGDLSTLTN